MGANGLFKSGLRGFDRRVEVSKFGRVALRYMLSEDFCDVIAMPQMLP